MTVTGTFDSVAQAEDAVAALEQAGIPSSSLMLVSGDEAGAYAEQVRNGHALVVVRTDDRALAERAREVMVAAAGEIAELDEAAASSRPDVPQLTPSGTRLYDVDGLEFDPVQSRFEDFKKQ